MNKLLFKLLFLWVTPILFAHNSDKIEKKKTLKKEYQVQANSNLFIENEYGNVNVTTWEQPKIEIEVVITVKSSDEDDAIQKLNDINIAFSQGTDFVKAVTQINSSNSKWFNVSFFNNSKVEFSIDYTIKMPITGNLNITNDYGFIYIDKLKGRCMLNNDYGGINIGSLYHSSNVINMDYGSNSIIEYIKSGKINADYSKININRAEKLDIQADYCTNQINDIQELTINSDYGSLHIGQVHFLTANCDYLNLNIVKLHKKISVENDYGSLKIENLDKNFESVKINSDFMTVKIGIHSETAFQFDIQTEFGSLTIDGLKPTYTTKEYESFSKWVKGYVNAKNAASQLQINSEYGGISLYFNN